jgi:hypothetical protein
MIKCVWCGRTFSQRRNSGRTQRFCGTQCRRALDAGLRAWTLAELAAGRITVDDIRNTSAAMRALCVGHSGTVGDGQTAGGDSMPKSAPPVFFEQYAQTRGMAR